MEISRIRALTSAAADHFITDKEPTHTRRRTVSRADSEAAARRREWQESHRNTVTSHPNHPKPRSTTPPVTRRGTGAPNLQTAARASSRGRGSGITLKELKGDIPDVRRAMREGVAPRFGDKTRRADAPREAAPNASYRASAANTTTANGSRSTTPGLSHAVAADTLRDARSVVERSSTSGVATGAGASAADEYIRGIEDLYKRMRDTYSELKQHPEAFLQPSSAGGHHSRSAMMSRPSPQRDVASPRRSYVPLRMPDAKVQEPSSEAARLREELDRLETRWEQLNKNVGAADGDTADDIGDPAPKSRDEVLSRLDRTLGAHRSVSGA